MRSEEIDRLGRQISRASRGPAAAYAEVLERAIAACEEDRDAAAYLDVLELHSELSETYDRLGQVEEALRHADVLVEHGYRCQPDPRCRRAEILTRHGRLGEAARIWEAVATDTPQDVWVYNNAGLEYGAVGEHELALSWLTRGLELAVRTGDPEGLVGQLRELRAASLTKLGRESDGLQDAEPSPTGPGRWAWSSSLESHSQAEREIGVARGRADQIPVAVAWLPADEYADWPARWPDMADSPLCHDELGQPVSHAVYCLRMEGRLRAYRESGVGHLSVVALRSAEFNPWVADTAPDERDPSQLRARYAADVGRDPSRTIAWPPGRNDPCWCESGRKYKRCCGVPGVTESPR